jgi:hypothetical protein
MPHAFKASRLTGLLALALALGLMAFGATAAQAEPGAFWEVNGSKLTGSASVQVKNDTPHITLLTKVGSTNVEILCGPIKLVNGVISGTGFTGKFHYEECDTFLNGVLASRCTPKSPGASLGLIETNTFKGLLKLTAAKEDVLELSPASGTDVDIEELGPLCGIGNKFAVTGKFTLKDCQALGLVNRVEHLFEEGPESALLFGGNAATIDGSAFVFLNGAHAGQTFSGHPA